VRQLIHELASPPPAPPPPPEAFEELPYEPVEVLPDQEELTVETLIDVLSGLLTPEDGQEGGDG